MEEKIFSDLSSVELQEIAGGGFLGNLLGYFINLAFSLMTIKDEE